MGKTPEELRWEIDQRRSDLTRDFEAIGDRVTPRRVVERRTRAVTSRFRNLRTSVMGTADRYGGHAQSTGVDLREQAGQTAEDLRSSAAGAVHRAQEGIHGAGERVAEVPGIVRHETEGNPLAAGLVAFGVGLLAATVLPETGKERRLARRVEPQLTDAARAAADTGRGLAEELKPAVQDSAASLQESARESAQHVADHAREAARSVTDDARSQAAGVRDAARS
jgi:gas vesicle protein